MIGPDNGTYKAVSNTSLYLRFGTTGSLGTVYPFSKVHVRVDCHLQPLRSALCQVAWEFNGRLQPLIGAANRTGGELEPHGWSTVITHPTHRLVAVPNLFLKKHHDMELL